MVQKNEPLPKVYRNFPYQYTVTRFGIVLRKNNEEVFLQGDDSALFMRDCNRAKQKGRNMAEVISEYFFK